MASVPEVKQYLAQWFQLGRKVYLDNGKVALLPHQVFHELGYSAEFEQCWQAISSTQGDCYLEDTTQTIADLLTSEWEIVECARCRMPVYLPVVGTTTEACPCHNLPQWPNDELPAPLSRAVVGAKQLQLQQRLARRDELHSQ